MSKKNETPLLSPKFALALQFANEIHGTQQRKGAGAPYISHLMAVSASVLEHGGNEAEAIAGLLHDAAEDCGGRPMLDTVRVMFGDDVAAIVDACTDAMEDPKPAWRPRKEAYVDHLASASPSVKLVAGCDKLHNLQTTLRDLRAGQPADYWLRFTAGAQSQAWYFRESGKALAGSPVAADFDRAYREFVGILRERGDLDD
ncbi:MAG: HD domain-containing protein [Azonexus sp.]|nr:HD domain-containing protein [Azonexus sp.]